MNINLTLLVQIGNFWITYYLLSKILLKPALRLLAQEQQELTHKEEVIIGDQEKLSRILLKKREELLDYQHALCEKFPAVPTHIPQFTSTSIQVTPLAAAQKKQLVHEVADVLVQKVSHD